MTYIYIYIYIGATIVASKLQEISTEVSRGLQNDQDYAKMHLASLNLPAGNPNNPNNS